MKVLSTFLIPAVILLVLVCCLPGGTRAQCLPIAANCSTNWDSVGRVFLCPDGLGPCNYSTLTVTVRNAAMDPCPGAIVDVVVDPSCITSSRVKFCNPVTLSATTNVSGVATLNLAGGGCCKQPSAVKILANSFVIRDWNAVMSSDYVGTDNTGIPSRWSLTLTPLDLWAITWSWGTNACHNYKNAGVVGPGELAIFASCYRGATNFCNP